jgi:hypothetical protein
MKPDLMTDALPLTVVGDFEVENYPGIVRGLDDLRPIFIRGAFEIFTMPKAASVEMLIRDKEGVCTRPPSCAVEVDRTWTHLLFKQPRWRRTGALRAPIPRRRGPCELSRWKAFCRPCVTGLAVTESAFPSGDTQRLEQIPDAVAVVLVNGDSGPAAAERLPGGHHLEVEAGTECITVGQAFTIERERAAGA